MKAFLLILCVFIYNASLAGDADTVYVSIDMREYDKIARQKLIERYAEESSLKYRRTSPWLLSNKYSIEELQTLSVPVFELKKQAKDYKCGDPIAPLIDFKQNPYFQVAHVAKNQKKVGGLTILDSFNESMRIKDSIDGYPFSLHSTPVAYDNRSTEKKIVKYIKKNPKAFVFMIKDQDGFWVIKKGRLYKLVRGKEKPGNRYFINHYGEDYVHDIVTEGLRTGYPYWSCEASMFRRFRSIFMKVEIKH